MASSSTPMTREQLNFSLIGKRLHMLRLDVKEASRWRPMEPEPKIIAFSDGIYPEVIHRAYEEGQRHFAEYSVQELVTKSNCGLIREYCPSINWHFFGSLKNTGIKRLAEVHNLKFVHSVGSTKDADILESIVKKNSKVSPLSISIKVNTGRERNVVGVLPEDADRLVNHLLRFSPHLHVKGLMTVGSHKYDQRPEFITLTYLRELLHRQFGLNLDVIMGWSKNFIHAIYHGANFIRMDVGIFGNEKKYHPIKTQL